ncbi:MAG: sulfatase [Planctomycetia bacterium]
MQALGLLPHPPSLSLASAKQTIMASIRVFRFLVLLLIVGCCRLVYGWDATTSAPPNIVLIFMDDMGYADPGPFGGDAELTPNLNEMAAEGRRFTDFYVSQSVCSASRASLLTGCYNIRIGIQGALGPKSRIGLNSGEMTIAELCRQKAYATACFGKWHLGHEEPFLPLQHGFDEYFGLPYSNDMWPFHPEVMHLPMEERLRNWPSLPLIENNSVIDAEVTAEDQKQLTRRYTEKAVSFIERNHKQPFFLYVPHSMVHVPLYAGAEFQGKSGKGAFSDVLMEIDWSVGQIVQTLRRLQLEDNTLVIFTSDNGPWLSYGNHAGSAGPLREGKGTMFDGGCRVPCIMKWPDRISPGSTCSEPAMTIDLLPTIAELMGGTLPDHPIDGKSISGLMCGEAEIKSPHDALYFYWGPELQAVRSGRWKMHFPHNYRTLNGVPGGKDGMPVKYESSKIGEALFDLSQDPGEEQNVLLMYPEITEKLRSLATEARTELGDGSTRGSGLRPAGQLESVQ